MRKFDDLLLSRRFHEDSRRRTVRGEDGPAFGHERLKGRQKVIVFNWRERGLLEAAHEGGPLTGARYVFEFRQSGKVNGDGKRHREVHPTGSDFRFFMHEGVPQGDEHLRNHISRRNVLDFVDVHENGGTPSSARRAADLDEQFREHRVWIWTVLLLTERQRNTGHCDSLDAIEE